MQNPHFTGHIARFTGDLDRALIKFLIKFLNLNLLRAVGGERVRKVYSKGLVDARHLRLSVALGFLT